MDLSWFNLLKYIFWGRGHDAVIWNSLESGAGFFAPAIAFKGELLRVLGILTLCELWVYKSQSPNVLPKNRCVSCPILESLHCEWYPLAVSPVSHWHEMNVWMYESGIHGIQVLFLIFLRCSEISRSFQRWLRGSWRCSIRTRWNKSWFLFWCHPSYRNQNRFFSCKNIPLKDLFRTAHNDDGTGMIAGLETK